MGALDIALAQSRFPISLESESIRINDPLDIRAQIVRASLDDPQQTFDIRKG